MAKTLNEASLLGATMVATSLTNFGKRMNEADPKPLEDFISKIENLEGTSLGSTTFTPGLIDSMKKLKKYLTETSDTAKTHAATNKALYEKHHMAHAFEQHAMAKVEEFNAQVASTKTDSQELF